METAEVGAATVGAPSRQGIRVSQELKDDPRRDGSRSRVRPGFPSNPPGSSAWNGARSTAGLCFGPIPRLAVPAPMSSPSLQVDTEPMPALDLGGKKIYPST